MGWNFGILGNRMASGTKIFNEFREEHIKTGFYILYTSAIAYFKELLVKM